MNDFEEAEPAPRSLASLTLIVVLAVLGCVALTALGTWQIQRRSWKLDLIHRVESRVHAPPIAAPGPAEWPTVTAAEYEYRHVRVSGTFLNDRETLVQAVTTLGPGFWVLTPLRTADGFAVLVNRGFIPTDRRDPAKRRAGEIAGETTITGLLRITEPGGSLLRSNDPSSDHWYSRDVAAIAAGRGLTDFAPYFIDADARLNAHNGPVGGLTVIAFPNNHLIYAITWYVLALMLAGGTAYVIRDQWQVHRTGSFQA